MFLKVLSGSIVALVLAVQGANASHVRQMRFYAPRELPKVICENDAVFTPRGSRLELDQQQGIVFAQEPGSLFVAICRHEKGGNQTVLVARVPGSLYKVSVRKFTSVQSIFKFVGVNWRAAMPPDEEVSLSVVGTKFSVATVGGGLQVGIDEGKVLGRSGGGEALATVGQGLTLMPGQLPLLYQIDYALSVSKLKVRQELGQNIVTGNLALGNSVKGATMEGNRFTLKTDQSFIEVQNANGTGRIIWLPVGVRPFFGS
jgi:hypothetical protein